MSEPGNKQCLEDVANPLHRHIKNIFAGSVSSALSRFIGQPLDVLKVRFQLQQTHCQHVAVEGTHIVYRSIPHALKLIYTEEGFRGLWRGHNVSQVQGFFQGITQFWAYEQFQQAFQGTRLGRVRPACDFAAGFCTGSLIVLMLSPMDILRTRLMSRSPILNGERANLMTTAHEIYATGGWRGFYCGCTSSVLHVGCLIGSKFMFYDMLCEFGVWWTEASHRSELTGPSLLVAGAGSGFFSNVATYPLDLVKRRLQMHFLEGVQHPHDSVCRDICQCTRIVLKKEGMRGLYKGFTPCCIKSVVSTAAQFSSYDMLHQWIDQYI